MLIREDGIYQTVWNKLYRREVLKDIFFEKGKYHEDDFWTYQVFDRMERLAPVSRPMYHYLQRSGSIMGAGYSIKRLDGMEARFRRMKDLSKYPRLMHLTRQQMILECMWHLQSILRHLQGAERTAAMNTVLKMKRQTPKVAGKDLTLNLKYRLWYRSFLIAPKFTARMRNLLNIGV